MFVFWCFDKAPKFKMSKVIWSRVWQADHKCYTHAFVSWGLFLFNVFAKLLFTCENNINEYEMKIKWAWMKRCCHILFLSTIVFFYNKMSKTKVVIMGLWPENRSPYFVITHWSGKSSLIYWAVCFSGGCFCITTAWGALLGVCVRCCAGKFEWRLLLNGHGGRLAAPNYD